MYKLKEIKLSWLLLIVALVLSGTMLTACGDDEPDDTGNNSEKISKEDLLGFWRTDVNFSQTQTNNGVSSTFNLPYYTLEFQENNELCVYYPVSFSTAGGGGGAIVGNLYTYQLRDNQIIIKDKDGKVSTLKCSFNKAKLVLELVSGENFPIITRQDKIIANDEEHIFNFTYKANDVMEYYMTDGYDY